MVWSDRPRTASGKASPSSVIPPRRTFSGGVGYMLVQCISANGTPLARSSSTDGRMVLMSFIPVLSSTGLPNEAMCRTSG